MKDIEIADIKDIADGVIDKSENIWDWINQPKKEARGFLLDLIKNDKELTSQQKSSLIYHSRKFTREYSNSKGIYEQAKIQFYAHTHEDSIDNDWLHFFFVEDKHFMFPDYTINPKQLLFYSSMLYTF